MRALHEEKINVPTRHGFDQPAGHAGLATVQAQVAGVEKRLAVGLDEKGHAVEGRVIDRVGGDAEVADLQRLRRLAGETAVLVEVRHAGEDGAGQEHLAGSFADDDGNLRLDVREQAGVVEVDVREKECIGDGLALK